MSVHIGVMRMYNLLPLGLGVKARGGLLGGGVHDLGCGSNLAVSSSLDLSRHK